MTVLMPELISAPGQLKLQLVDSVTITGPLIATEVKAASSLDISCFVLAEGWNPDTAQAKGTAPRRVCTVATQETLGAAAETLADLLYAHDPQGDDAADANKLYTKATPGTTKFVIARYGLPYDTDWAADQYVNIHKVRFGVQTDVAPISDDNGVLHIKQALINTIPVIRRVQLVA